MDKILLILANILFIGVTIFNFSTIHKELWNKDNKNNYLRGDSWLSVSVMTVTTLLIFINIIVFLGGADFIFGLKINEMSYELAKIYFQSLVTVLAAFYTSFIIGISIHWTSSKKESSFVLKRATLNLIFFVLWLSFIIYIYFVIPLLNRLALLN